MTDKLIPQRILDTKLDRWCYYESTSILKTPDPASTIPQHTGHLNLGSHEVLTFVDFTYLRELLKARGAGGPSTGGVPVVGPGGAGLPPGGTDGQIIVRTATGYVWADNTATSAAGTPTTSPDASVTVKGLVKLANSAAITAGTALLVVDAAQLKSGLDSKEADLGTPTKDGQVLSGSADGTRTWVDLPAIPDSITDLSDVTGPLVDGRTLVVTGGKVVLEAPVPTVPLSSKGVANGVAGLNAAGKVPQDQLELVGFDFKGAWDASTNTPTLAWGTGRNEESYIVSVAGSQDLGGGVDIDFLVGDLLVYSDTASEWQHIPLGSAPAAPSVSTVNGRTGVVTGILDSDGSVELDAGFAPTTDQGISTKKYVDDSVFSKDMDDLLAPGGVVGEVLASDGSGGVELITLDASDIPVDPASALADDNVEDALETLSAAMDSLSDPTLDSLLTGPITDNDVTLSDSVTLRAPGDKAALSLHGAAGGIPPLTITKVPSDSSGVHGAHVLDMITTGVGQAGIYHVNGDPSGKVSGYKGSLAVDSANAKLYQNTDGSSAWVDRSAIPTLSEVILAGDNSRITMTKGNQAITLESVETLTTQIPLTIRARGLAGGISIRSEKNVGTTGSAVAKMITFRPTLHGRAIPGTVSVASFEGSPEGSIDKMGSGSYGTDYNAGHLYLKLAHDWRCVSARVHDVVIMAREAGTSSTLVGSVRLNGISLHAGSAFCGTDDAAHTGVVEIRKEADNSLITSFHASGTPASVEMAAPVTITPGWYTIIVKGDDATSTVILSGLQLEVR